jgi:hypothetical protein
LDDVTPVECYSGFRYAERPLAIHWLGQRLEVEVESAWLVPGGQRFRVHTGDGQVFELVYREADDAWQITPGADYGLNGARKNTERHGP